MCSATCVSIVVAAVSASTAVGTAVCGQSIGYFELPRLAFHHVCPTCYVTGRACELCHPHLHTCPCTPPPGLSWCPSRSVGVLCTPCALLCLMLPPSLPSSMQFSLAMGLGFVSEGLVAFAAQCQLPIAGQFPALCTHVQWTLSVAASSCRRGFRGSIKHTRFCGSAAAFHHPCVFMCLGGLIHCRNGCTPNDMWLWVWVSAHRMGLRGSA
jgi:hypothetical protein